LLNPVAIQTPASGIRDQCATISGRTCLVQNVVHPLSRPNALRVAPVPFRLAVYVCRIAAHNEALPAWGCNPCRSALLRPARTGTRS
jgi:hypothetical protein